MALPHATTGSLRPAFASARLVGLAVKHPSTFALYARLPTVLRVPLHSSVTLWEETAPVKLPTIHCSQPGLRAEVRTPKLSGWYFNVPSMRASAPTSKGPTYPTQTSSKFSVKL